VADALVSDRRAKEKLFINGVGQQDQKHQGQKHKKSIGFISGKAKQVSDPKPNAFHEIILILKSRIFLKFLTSSWRNLN